MGVSGSGKTTIGVRLSKILDVPFYDADDYHNDECIQKMKQGRPLDDTDRESWLSLLAVRMKRWDLQGNAILACSALRTCYRNKLTDDNNVSFIFLDGSYKLIRNRLLDRKNHYFLASMLKSQFRILEPPINCIRVSIDKSKSDICLSIIENINKN